MSDTWVAVVVAVAVVVVVCAALLAYQRHVWRTVERRQVIVVTGETSIRGLLWARRGPLLVIRDAVIMRGQPVPADGEIVIERRHVDWMQVLP